MHKLLAAVLGAVLVTGQNAQQSGAAAATLMSSYYDDATKLTYRYPTEFQAQLKMKEIMTGALAGPPDDPGRNAVAKCIAVPLTVAKGLAAGATDFAVIVLMRVDHICMGEPGSKGKLGEAAQQMARVIGVFGTPLTADALYYRLDGHDAAFVKGSARADRLGEGIMIHSAAVCALVGENTECWLILASDYKAMPSLVADTVKFDDGNEVPLVPKDMVEAW